MFVGTSAHTLDDKGRLVLPAKYRDDLEDGAFVTKSIDGCLSIYRAEDFRARTEEMKEQVRAGALPRNAIRSLSAGASEANLDRQGRVTIPPPLREYAALTGPVVVTGFIDHLEIWDTERWRAVDADGSASLQDATDLANLA